MSTSNGELATQPQLPIWISQGPAYKGCFFDALLDRYLPDTTSPIGFEGMLDMFRYGAKAMPVTCSAWIISACHSAVYDGNDVLSESVLSMALTLIGAERNDPTISMTGLRAYQRALTRVQTGVAVVLAGNATSTEMSTGFLPLSCLACAMTEFMANRSVASFSRHLDGIALLIQHIGPAGLEHPTMRALFYEHRGIYVAFSFLDRKSCFYSREGWIDFTWKAADKHASSHVQTLFDIAYLIPELMEEYDSTPHASVGCLKEMMQCVSQFDLSLDQWKTEMDNSVTVPIVIEEDQIGSEHLFSDHITFASIGVATAMLYYWAFKIYLSHMAIDIGKDLPDQGGQIALSKKNSMSNALAYARKLCRSMEYCFNRHTGVLGKLVGLFPFDAAWQTFIRAKEWDDIDVSLELKFCQKSAQRFRDMGITLFRDR